MKDINIKLPQIKSNQPEILMSGINKNGDSIGVNRKYFTKQEQPWFPITGEFHYSRYPSEYWKEALQKMKAGGLDTVATYVFWIHHEEIEGRFIWEGNLDLKRFISLCYEVGLSVILRIGPWDHGEVRNGGYPDWLYEKTAEPGTNDPIYFMYSQRLYTEIYNQVNTFFYKDNGPIIGIQIDNEYGHCHGLKGDPGREHMMTLKKMAIETGFDVPFYTATGWGGAIVVEGEFLPVMAAYVEGSWEQHIDVVPPNINYLFTSVRDDQSVGSDLAKIEIYTCTYDINNYPFATCELGSGMQSNYQRRPIITAQDTEGMAFVKLGSGAIMLGYYMYQGGTNPVGELTTFQETRATGFPNDLPKITYDYQAPLGEYGQSNPSYKALRRLHYFAKEQQDILTRSTCIIPNDQKIRPDDASSLRYAIRYLGDVGFIFINNYQHNVVMESQEDLRFTVELDNETITFPSIDVKSRQWRMLPFNQDLHEVKLKCSTMQPLTSITVNDITTYFYYGELEQDIEYRFDTASIKEVTSFDGKLQEHHGVTIINQIFVDDHRVVEHIVLKNLHGETVRIVTLTKEQASNFAKFEINGQSYGVITEGDVFVEQNQLQLISIGETKLNVWTFPELPETQKLSNFKAVDQNQGLFYGYSVIWQPVSPKINFIEIEPSRNGNVRYKLQMEEGFMNSCADVFLNIDFDGDIAELTQNGILKAEWYYTGLTWKVGLKRFARDLSQGLWVLEISPLKEDAFVYLDLWPEMIDGKAMQLKSYKAVPEYRLFN